MALHYNTLGGGAAQSGTATPGRYEDLNVCTGCGFESTIQIVGRDGLEYDLCETCEIGLREQEAEQEWCEDCAAAPAVCVFMHLDGRVFNLCDFCYYAADHEEDYLKFCECPTPEISEEGTQCWKCNREVRPYEEPLCDCPVPSVIHDEPDHCVFCMGAIPKPKEE